MFAANAKKFSQLGGLMSQRTHFRP